MLRGHRRQKGAHSLPPHGTGRCQLTIRTGAADSRLAQDLSAGKKPKQVFAAAAVAVPGLVRPNGTVWAPNLPGWNALPLASRLRQSLGLPVVVESDRNAAVVGDCWRGAARGKSDVIVLMIGTGIGAGILSGGRIVRGAHELSGCAGWLTVMRENVPNT